MDILYRLQREILKLVFFSSFISRSPTINLLRKRVLRLKLHEENTPSVENKHALDFGARDFKCP